MPDVFVFGSNLMGIHGRGAALHAKKYFGAIQGQGHGRQGDSYAIPTKFSPAKSLPLEDIQKYVLVFLQYASFHNGESFMVTPIGCGLAGYTPEQIAPMFKNSPNNVNLPQEFKDVLQRY